MAFVRSVVERWSRGKKFRRQLAVSGKNIPIYISPDAQLKYLRKSTHWDQDLIALAMSCVKPNDDVWDIGANIGVFSFAAAAMSKTGNIYAFEPDTFLVEVIKASKKLNGLENVHILPIGISDKDGFANFLIAKRGRASNSLETAGGRSQMGGVREKVLIPALTGESVHKQLGSTPQLIKIDVEGAELMVLEGLQQVLKTAKPILYIELGEDTKMPALKLLSELGYVSEESTNYQPGLQNFLLRSK